MTDIEREREAFQKWASDTLIIPSFYFDRAPGVDGEYDRKGTQMRWEAWLARAQSERVVGMGELEALADAFERGGDAVRSLGRLGKMCAGTRADCAASLRAIIAKAGVE